MLRSLLLRNWAWFFAFCLCLLPTQQFAHIYQDRLERAKWHLEPSRLECRMWQSVPSYGDVVFSQKAGEDLRFLVSTIRPLNKRGEVSVSTVSPIWVHDDTVRQVGKTSMTPGSQPLLMGASEANFILAELKLGRVPRISHPGWYGKHPMEIAVLATNFMPAYINYMDCLSALLPVRYGDLVDTTIYYGENSTSLSRTERARLALIADFMLVDEGIAHVKIDSFADHRGTRGVNMMMSKRRSDTIAQFFMDAGLSADRIKTSYHGEPFPHVRRKNDSAAKRAYSRRSLVKLVRSDF